MISDFNKNSLDLKRLNYGVITLVPKVKEANNTRQYRAMCLLNVDFKVFFETLDGQNNPHGQ
jgi:hypothetical protein